MASRRGSKSLTRYRLNGFNRLVVTSREGLHTKRIIEGTVKTDNSNRLTYLVDAPVFSKGNDEMPRKFNLDGTWSLTRDHRLKLTLHNTTGARRQSLYLKGNFVEAKAHSLSFALRQHRLNDRTTSERLTLSGRWQADRKNRLTFLVGKTGGAEDRLTFQSGWTVNKHNELRYRYEQRIGRRKTRTSHVLRFSGIWDISQANRLIYRLDVSGDSAFEFRAAFQTPSLNARDGRIVYQVGIGLSGRQMRRERVVLFGAWKLNRDFSVSFEMPYKNGRRDAYRLEGKFRITPSDDIIAKLSDRRGKSLGLSVTFSRRFLNSDVRLFLQLHREAPDTRALTGAEVKF